MRKTKHFYQNYEDCYIPKIDDFDFGYIITDKLSEVRNDLSELFEYKKRLINTLTGKDRLFIDFVNEDIKYKLSEIKKWEYLEKRMKGENEEDNYDLDAIKRIPLKNIILKEPVSKAVKRWLYSSPYRNEENASFVWYIDSNRWWDYGAGEGGTIIDLYMKLNDCDIKKAIYELNKIL